MEITITHYDNCDLVALQGEVFASDAPVLESKLQRFLDVGRYQILLDMRDCTYISSAGLSLLINFANSCRRWDRGDLYLIAPHKSVMNLLQITGLRSEDRSFFPIFDTVMEALAEVANASP